MRSILRSLLLSGLALGLTGCAYWVKPKTVTRYDDECEIGFRHMTLTAEQVPLLSTACTGAMCGEQAVAQLILTPLSAIVSGSIVLVGNTVYWMQKQGRCERAEQQLAASGDTARAPRPDEAGR